MNRLDPDERWAKIGKDCKPSKATSSDKARPALHHGFVHHNAEGVWLVMTDSYILVRLPIEIPCAKKDAKRFLPPGPIPAGAMRALDKSKSGRFRINEDGYVEVADADRFEGQVVYRRPTGVKPIDFDGIYKKAIGDGKRKLLAGVSFNPELLRRMGEAFGTSTNYGLQTRFRGPLKPIMVEPQNGFGVGDGLLMPIRGVDDS